MLHKEFHACITMEMVKLLARKRQVMNERLTLNLPFNTSRVIRYNDTVAYVLLIHVPTPLHQVRPHKFVYVNHSDISHNIVKI